MPAVGGAASLVERVESPYNTIFVYRESTYITLAFGYKSRLYVESRRNTADLIELPVAYTRALTAAVGYPGTIGSVVMIGMGGGATSWYLHEHMPEVSVSAVELDPEIIRLSEKYFDLRPERNFRIVEADGRVFLFREKSTFDIVFVDAYRGPFVPFHLLTKEFYTLIKRRLRPGGVVAQNVEPSTMLFDSAHATLLSVFDNVDFFPANGNMVAIAYDGKRKSSAELRRRAQERQGAFRFRYHLPTLIGRRRSLPSPAADIEPLTDDFAPVNVLRAAKRHNRKWE